jgi:hypothetical protein
VALHLTDGAPSILGRTPFATLDLNQYGVAIFSSNKTFKEDELDPSQNFYLYYSGDDGHTWAVWEEH